jgi:hypothetical protein
MAAVNLKNYIDKFWSAAIDDFIGPEPSIEVGRVGVHQKYIMLTLVHVFRERLL